MMSRRVVPACVLLASLSTASVALAELSDAERTQRAADIRDVAADNGISAGYLLAGIAQAETRLCHCYEEYGSACEGPGSVDCGGGPVLAGGGDGPCSIMEGGLGMFQFDGGTFDETINRDGDGVLLLSGNVTRAVDFVVDMVMGSVYVDADTSTPAAAKAWMNTVVVDGAGWDAWIQTVTHYYNGCTPSGCGVYDQRFQHYSDSGADVYFEMGADFWDVELTPCAPIGDGRVLEETDPCFTKGGPLPYWRVGIGGESNLHVWTGTTDLDEAINFAEWQLLFDEPGAYRVEVSVAEGTTPLATYAIDHAGTTSSVVIDQGGSEGFVELGVFDFAAGGSQRVFLGDNTGDSGDQKLAVDALRVTRIGGGEGGGDPAGGVTVGAGGGIDPGAGGSDGDASGVGGSDDGVGAGGEGGGDGGGDAAGAGDDSGCDCAAGPGAPSGGAWTVGLAGLALALLRRRRRA